MRKGNESGRPTGPAAHPADSLARPGRAQVPIRPPGAPEEAVLDAECGRCGDCVAVCPQEVLVVGRDGLPEIDPAVGMCMGCGLCADVCTYSVIRAYAVIEPPFERPLPARRVLAAE